MPRRRHALVASTTLIAGLLLPLSISAQPLGTFQWQLQPYCNVVTVTVSQQGTKFTLDGTDDLCGAAQQASLVGVAFFNSDGTVGFGFTTVAPGSAPSQLSATISPAGLSGSWQDDSGHSGTFAYAPTSVSGALRPAVGQTRIAISPGDWRPFTSADNLTFSYFSGRILVAKATIGSNFLSVHPTLPVVVNGRRQRLMGAELCYQASSTVPLTLVEINTLTHTATPSTLGSRNIRFTESTPRTDQTCRFYPLASPYTLTGEDAANLFIGFNWTVASEFVEIDRATFVLEPTTTSVASDELPSETAQTSAPDGPSSTNPRRPGGL